MLLLSFLSLMLVYFLGLSMMISMVVYEILVMLLLVCLFVSFLGFNLGTYNMFVIMFLLIMVSGILILFGYVICFGGVKSMIFSLRNFNLLPSLILVLWFSYNYVFFFNYLEFGFFFDSTEVVSIFLILMVLFLIVFLFLLDDLIELDLGSLKL